MKCASKIVPVLLIAATIGLTACASRPGAVASDVPPRLVSNGVGLSTVNTMSWDRPEAFGPVPADQLAKGQASCGRLGEGWKPTGYHPRAQSPRPAAASIAKKGCEIRRVRHAHPPYRSL
jgi:hypothetical protein